MCGARKNTSYLLSSGPDQLEIVPAELVARALKRAKLIKEVLFRIYLLT